MAFVEAPGYRPFYVVTTPADLMAIERANDLFVNGPRPVLMTAAQEDLQAAQGEQALKTRIDELAGIFVDRMTEGGDTCGLVQDDCGQLSALRDHVVTGCFRG